MENIFGSALLKSLIYIYSVYIYIYIVYMWQMSSVFSHESAQRNDAGHLIMKMSLKQRQNCRVVDIFIIYIYTHIYISDIIREVKLRIAVIGC